MSADRDGLRRVLGLWDATCIVIGAIIGVGIFFNPRDVASVTGSSAGALLAWAIGGVIAMLGAFTFAELGRLRPQAGGQYHILRDAYGRAPAFLFVFCNLTAVQAGGVAIISIVFARHLGVALHGTEPGPAWALTVATASAWALVAANVVGVRAGARLQNGTVIAKLVILGALIALAAVVPAGRAAAPAAGAASPLSFAALFSGVTLTLFAYGGWQQSLWMAGEIEAAERTVPRAIVLGVTVVVIVYLAANWAFLHLLGFAGVRASSTLAADAFSVWSPGIGRRVAAAGVAISALGVLNAQFLAGPRLTWAMAREGQFFAPFAKLSPRFATPAAAIVLLGALASGLTLGLGLSRTDQLTTGVVVVDAVFFALTGLALVVLRRRQQAGQRGAWQLVPAALAFSLLELLAIAGSVAQHDARRTALGALGWIAAAILVWLAWFRSERAPAP